MSNFMAKEDEGLWRCSCCGEAKTDADNATSVSWRWAGDVWEHRCAEMEPQAGHFPARFFPTRLGAEVARLRADLERVTRHKDEHESLAGLRLQERDAAYRDRDTAQYALTVERAALARAALDRDAALAELEKVRAECDRLAVGWSSSKEETAAAIARAEEVEGLLQRFADTYENRDGKDASALANDRMLNWADAVRYLSKQKGGG